MKKTVVISLLALLLFSCKKNKEQTNFLSGTIFDGINGGGISGASVTLSYQQYQSGVASSAFTSIGTVTTGADGRYSFTFEKPTATQYRIQVSKTNHFGASDDFNPESIETNVENVRNYIIYPTATFKVGMTNVGAFNNQDKIVYQNTSETAACATCCNNGLVTFIGSTVDTSLTCTKYGDQYVKFKWTVTKNNFSQTFTDSVFCPQGQLTTYQINY